MISLRSHDRVGRTTAAVAARATLPGVDERAALARRWAEAAPNPTGVRRGARRSATRTLAIGHSLAVEAILEPVIEGLSLGEGDDVDELRAFAARMLSGGRPGGRAR